MRLIGIFLLIFFSIQAEIVDIKNIDECKKLAQPGMLILFDIDNTIMETAQTLGGDQWFNYQIADYEKRGFSKQEALQITRAEWVFLQNRTKVKPVESTTVQMIENLQKNGTKVMALTTRGLYIARRTVEQLQSIGVHFDAAAPLRGEKFFDHEQGIFYRDGILFCSGNSKGSCLFRFFEETGYQPKKIMVVDDRISHLQDVEKACVTHQLPFLGLRYGFLDEKVKNLNPEIVKEQMEHFGHLLSDEDAEQIYSNHLKNLPLDSR